MASVQKRDHSAERSGQSGQSGFFELGKPQSAGPGLEAGPASVDASANDPVVRAFGEVRGLNTRLQRANDALHIVNEELRTRVEELRLTALDLEQMLDGLELGVLLVDGDLKLRHFNSMAAHFLALEDQDVGGALSATCRGLGSRLAEWCREVLRSGKRIRRTFQSAIAEPLSLQVRRTRVDGELRLILVLAEATEFL